MAPKSSSGKGAGSSGKAGLKTSKLGSQPGSRRYSSEAKWTISDYKPQRQISEQELKKAREIFFSLDSDMSGSIEAEEIRVMLHSLGQNPTDEELQELIDSVDEGEKDGKIQLREFLKLYTMGLDNKNKGSRNDADHVFRAANEFVEGVNSNGAPKDTPDSIPKANVAQMLFGVFGLSIDIDEVLGLPGKSDSISREVMSEFLMAMPGAASTA